METQINPYLMLNGNCREVLGFYHTCFGGDLSLMAIKDSPMAAEWPAAMQDNILHGALTSGNLMIMGADMGSPSDEGIVGNTITLSLTCGSVEEIDRFFTKLSDGGVVERTPHDFFAGKMAALKDKFGISWMLYFNNNQN